MRPLAIAIAATVFLTSIPFTYSDSPDLDGLRRNPMLLGQMTGCLMRFRAYADMSELEYMTAEQIEKMLRTYFGDIDGNIDNLIDMEKEMGFTDAQVQASWELVETVAKSELEDGSAWIQTIACYSVLQDHGLVK